MRRAVSKFAKEKSPSPEVADFSDYSKAKEEDSEEFEELIDYTAQLADFTFEDVQGKTNNKRRFYEVWAPDSVFKSIWDVLGFIFIVYQSLLVPYRISFDQEATGDIYYFELLQDVYFMTDILVCFNTGAYIDGALVMRRKDSMLHYIKTWFLLDILASFPYDMMIGNSN